MKSNLLSRVQNLEVIKRINLPKSVISIRGKYLYNGKSYSKNDFESKYPNFKDEPQNKLITIRRINPNELKKKNIKP